LQGVSSLKLLREAYAQVRRRGFELVNADVVLIGQEPKVAPVREQMQGLLAGTLEVDKQRISVRATTTDELGFTGRGEGLAAQAVALLQSSA
jgi:2-C-methyl-D-erythritol 2,4-cyclodiphosphate synthase